MADSDDYLVDGWLTKLRQSIEESASYKPDIITYDYLKENSNKRKCVCKLALEKGIYEGDAYQKMIMLLQIPHFMWGRIYKRSFLLKCDYLNYLNVNMAEDWMTNILVGCFNPTVYYSDIIPWLVEISMGS